MKKIGLIGVGKMGLSHLAIANSIENVSVTAMCDTSKLMLTVLGRGLKKTRVYTSYQDMLNAEQLDGVVISLPNSLHYACVKLCLEKGLHTFIEKPLTLSPETSKELLDLSIKHNKVLQVGYVNRFCDSFQYVRELVQSNSFGKVLSYRSEMMGPVIVEPHENGWRNDYTKGGGCLNDYGPHCLDLVCYLFGEDFQLENAKLEKVFSTNVDDIVEASFKHSNGFSGSVYINWSDNTVRKASNIVTIELEQAKIRVSKQEIEIESKIDVPSFAIQQGQNKKYITDFSTDVSYYLRGEEFSRQLIEFAKSIDGHSSTITSATAAVKVDQTIADIFKYCGVHNG